MDLPALIEQAANLRGIIGDAGETVRNYRGLLTDAQIEPGLSPAPDKGEAIANVMLAFRHLEDAKMRLGKCIQALDGGVSCYPR